MYLSFFLHPLFKEAKIFESKVSRITPDPSEEPPNQTLPFQFPPFATAKLILRQETPAFT